MSSSLLREGENESSLLLPTLRFRYHSLAIERNGHATSWGRGGEGQLGSGTRYSTSRPSPMVSTNPVAACPLTMFKFASNEGGARQGTAAGVVEEEATDVQAAGLYGCKLKMIAAGDWHTVRKTEEGEE